MPAAQCASFHGSHFKTDKCPLRAGACHTRLAHTPLILRRLLPHVCRNGAAQLLVILLDVVEASSKALAAEILVSCTLESLSVLHHVVTSGSQAAVLALIAWAEQKSFHLQVCPILTSALHVHLCMAAAAAHPLWASGL